MNRIIFVLVIILAISACSPKSISQKGTEYNQGPSSLNPGESNRQANRYSNQKEEKFLFFFKKKQKVSWGDQLVEEYEERMKQNAKEARKKAKEMEKPQYSDPMYFGHKKKPKKRPPHKMKYCEECGIRH